VPSIDTNPQANTRKNITLCIFTLPIFARELWNQCGVKPADKINFPANNYRHLRLDRDRKYENPTNIFISN
jgi:hypothetical protein